MATSSYQSMRSVRASGGGAAELAVEPEAEVVQGDDGGQPSQEAGEVTGTIDAQGEGPVQVAKTVSTIWRWRLS